MCCGGEDLMAFCCTFRYFFGGGGRLSVRCEYSSLRCKRRWRRTAAKERTKRIWPPSLLLLLLPRL